MADWTMIGSVAGGLFSLLIFLLVLLMFLEVKKMVRTAELTLYAMEKGFGLKKSGPPAALPGAPGAPPGAPGQQGTKQCPSCGYMNPTGSTQCGYCYAGME